MAQQPTNKRASTYSNGDMPSYDSFLSSMQYRFFNQIGVIDIATMNPEFRGKTPKAGDKVYDHENRLSVYVNATSAMAMLAGIKRLREALDAEAMAEEDEEVMSIKSVTIPIGINKTCVITAPGRSRIKLDRTQVVDTENNFVVRFNVERDGNPESAYHILQNTTLTFHTMDKEELEDIEYTGLDLLVRFLEQVIGLATGAYRQGAALAAPRGESTGGKRGGNGFANILEDDDDEQEIASDDDDDEVVTTKKPPRTGKGLTAKRPSASKAKPVTTTSLEAEFDDDELPE